MGLALFAAALGIVGAGTTLLAPPANPQRACEATGFAVVMAIVVAGAAAAVAADPSWLAAD